MKNIIKNFVYFFFHRLFCLLPLKKRVVFTSFGGKQYSCNPRAISEKLAEVYPYIEQIWIMNTKPPIFIKHAKIVTGKIKRIYYYATSKFLIDNSILNPIFKRRKNQFYIETWHGDCSFKRIGMDSSIRYDKDSHKMKYQFNYAVTGSRFGEEYIFKKAIPFDGSLLKVGSPRNDIFFNGHQELTKTIKKELNLSDECGILLYAPTFRDSHKDNDVFRIDFDVHKILALLKENDPFHRNWVALLRLHSAEKATFASIFSEDIIDVTEYYDMANLLLISDLCISDYSSCSIDFAVANKVSVLFHFDKQNYSKSDRELLFDDEELPFLIANNETDLANIVSEVFLINKEEYAKKIKDFYGIYDNGTASVEISRFIAKNI